MPAIEAGSLKQSFGSHLGNQVQKFRCNGQSGGLFTRLPVAAFNHNRDNKQKPLDDDLGTIYT